MKTQDLEVIKERFISVLDEETFNKEASFAVQIFNKNKYLNSSTQSSKLEAVLNVAQTGLTLNPVKKMAYLVPRSVRTDNGYEVQCTLMPSYQGLAKLVTDTGSVRSIASHIVRKGDKFEYELGTNPTISHKPELGNEGNIVGVYSVATLKDGSKMIEVMSNTEIYEIRANSDSYKAYESKKVKSCIWIDYEGEMFRKTVLKRLTKYLPKTELWDKLDNAINQDNEDYRLTWNQECFIDNLLTKANLPQQEIDSISGSVSLMNTEDAKETIEYLLQNQVPSELDRGTMSATEFKNFSKAKQIEVE